MSQETFSVPYFEYKVSTRKVIALFMVVVCVYSLIVFREDIQHIALKNGQEAGANITQHNEDRYMTHRFTDAGFGHKFSELLFSMDVAKQRNLKYCFDEASFLANSRNDDYSFILPAIYETIPKCSYNVKPVRTSSGWNFCEDAPGKNCFFSPVRFFNDNPSLFRFDTSRLTKDTTGEPMDALGIHLRFGDVQANGDVDAYVHRIDHIKALTGLQESDISFCFHSENESEDLLPKLRATFKQAKFVNSKSLLETMTCLTQGRIMMTSGSSFSYVTAYLCKDCAVFYNRPKELYGSNEKIDSRTSPYYLDRFIVLPDHI